MTSDDIRTVVVDPPTAEARRLWNLMLDLAKDFGAENGDRPPTQVRRPDLLGAILIKARVVAKKRDKFASDRQDLIRLLSYVEDSRTLAVEGRLRSTEKKWLKRIQPLIASEDPKLARLFAPEPLERARQAVALLIA